MSKLSLRNPINMYCKSCVYDAEVRGSWRKQVEDCGCTDCQLYPVRPMPFKIRVESVIPSSDGEKPLCQDISMHLDGLEDISSLSPLNDEEIE